MATYAIRRKKYLRFLVNITLCQFVTAGSIILACASMVLIDPVARTDMFLLREGKTAPTPIYDVACGNLGRKIEALAERRQFLQAIHEFDRNVETFQKITGSKLEPTEAEKAMAVSSFEDAGLWVEVFQRRMHHIEAIDLEMQEAWSRLRHSYPSMRVAYWLSLVLFIATFTVTAIHMVRVVVLQTAKAKRRGAIACLVAALATPYLVFGTYGGAIAYRNIKQPDQALLEEINAAHLEAEQKATICPKTSSKDLW